MDIIFDVIDRDHGRDLYLLNHEDKSLKANSQDIWDERDPSFNDSVLVYSSDLNGIYNLYVSNGNQLSSITDVSGGAFMPSLLEDKVLYSLYDNGQYKIALIENINNISNTVENNINNGHWLASYIPFVKNKTGLILGNFLSVNYGIRDEINLLVGLVDSDYNVKKGKLFKASIKESLKLFSDNFFEHEPIEPCPGKTNLSVFLKSSGVFTIIVEAPRLFNALTTEKILLAP